MTTPTAPDAPSRAARRPRTWVVASVVVVLAAVAAGIWLWPSVRWSLWIRGADKAEYFELLVKEKDERIVAKVDGAMRDDGFGTKVRVALASVLIKKDRMPWVEKALRVGDLGTRTVVLTALNSFQYLPQYLDDPAYHVRETLLEWIRREGDDTRGSAIEMLTQPGARVPEVVPVVRAILTAAPGADGHPANGVGVRMAAVVAAAAYQDCESVPALVAMAKRDPDPVVELRAVQALAGQGGLFGPPPSALKTSEKPTDRSPCASALPESTVLDVLAAALAHPGDDSENRSVRMGVFGILATRPSWAKLNLAAIRARLDPSVPDVERNSALPALLASGEPSVLEEFPRWFHDPSPQLRGSAVRMVTWMGKPYDDPKFRACLVGYVRDETDEKSFDMAFVHALARLREAAGEWVGFPAKRVRSSGAMEEGLRAFLRELFVKGAAEGVTRASVADAWFRWLAGAPAEKGGAGLDAAGVDAAVRARGAFWEKARAGDVAGARAALADPAGESKSPHLFTYERGWLLAHGA